MPDVSNAIQAIANSNGSFDIALSWGWHPATDTAHGWVLYVRSTDSETYCDPTNIETDHDQSIKIASKALSHTLHGVQPTNRFSFAIQPYFNASEGTVFGDIVSFQRSTIWDGTGDPPAPDQNDWVDFQPLAYVDLNAPRTSAELFEEDEDSNGKYVIVDLTVDDRNNEGTTTEIRASRGFGNWHEIPDGQMLVINPSDSSTGTEAEPSGLSGRAVKVYRDLPTVVLQYRSIGDQSGRVEEIREFIIDQDKLPEINRTNITLPFDGVVSDRLLWWWGDDDVDLVYLFEVTDTETGDEVAVSNPDTGNNEFEGTDTYRITGLGASEERVYRIEPRGRNIDAQRALELSQRVTVNRTEALEATYELVLEFNNIDLSLRHGVTITLAVKTFTDNLPVENADVKYTETPEDPQSWQTLTTDASGEVTTPTFDRPSPFDDRVLYFQAEKNGKISPVKEYVIDDDRIAELHQVAFEFDGAVSLVFTATGDDDVGALKLDLSEVSFKDDNFSEQNLEVVHLENVDGDFEHVFQDIVPGEAYYVRAVPYDAWDADLEEVDGEAGFTYYDSATRLISQSVELYSLEEVSRTDDASTWEFFAGENMAQANIYWEDDEYPDLTVFNPDSDPKHEKVVLDSGSGPYQFSVDLPESGVTRFIVLEGLDGNGYVTDVELVQITVKKGVPPRISARSAVADGTTDIFATVRSLQGAYPVDLRLFEQDGGTYESVNNISVSSSQGGLEQTLGSDIYLPFAGSKKTFKIEAEDSEGLTSFLEFDVDRDFRPSAVLDKVDGAQDPIIYIDYDDDVEWIRLTLPGGGTKTWTSLDAGFEVGGEVEYQVNVTTLDDASLESLLTTGEERGRYKVEVGDNIDPPLVAGYVTLRGPLESSPVPALDLDVTPGASQYTVDITPEESDGDPLPDFAIERDTGSGFSQWKTDSDGSSFTDTIDRADAEEVIHRYRVRDNRTNFFSSTYLVEVPPLSSSSPILEVDTNSGEDTYSFTVTPYKSDGTTVLTDYVISLDNDDGLGYEIWETDESAGAGEPPFTLDITRASASGDDKVIRFKVEDNDTGFTSQSSHLVPAKRAVFICSVQIDATPVSNGDEDLDIYVYPDDATVTAKVNGNDVTGSLVEEATGHYSYTLQRSKEEDQRFVVTVSQDGFVTVSGTYTIDRDQSPGASHVLVEDRVKKPTIRAFRDDDATDIRILVDGSEVDTTVASGPPDPDTTDTLAAWTATSDFLPEEEKSYTIEVSGDGGTSWTEVASGTVYGPPSDPLSIVPSIGAGGEVEFDFSAAQNIDSLRYEVSTSSFPDETGDTSAWSTVSNSGNSGSISTGFSLDPGQRGYITVLAYTSSDASGTHEYVAKARTSAFAEGGGLSGNVVQITKVTFPRVQVGDPATEWGWEVKVGVLIGDQLSNLEVSYTDPETGTPVTGKTWSASELDSLDYEFPLQDSGGSNVQIAPSMSFTRINITLTPKNASGDAGDVAVVTVDPTESDGVMTEDSLGNASVHAAFVFPSGGGVDIGSDGSITASWDKGTSEPGSLNDGEVFFVYVD